MKKVLPASRRIKIIFSLDRTFSCRFRRYVGQCMIDDTMSQKQSRYRSGIQLLLLRALGSPLRNLFLFTILHTSYAQFYHRNAVDPE